MYEAFELLRVTVIYLKRKHWGLRACSLNIFNELLRAQIWTYDDAGTFNLVRVDPWSILFLQWI